MRLRIVRPRLRIVREGLPKDLSDSLWSVHNHSQFSVKDALPTVAEMVATVAGMGQPAMGLTDHGNTAGSVQLYTECRRHDLLPFPGSEFYVVTDRAAHAEATKAKGATPRHLKRHHFCVVAYTSTGYANLVGLSTLSHRNFYNKPLLDHCDLATLAEQGLLEGLAATSGCYFSLASQSMVAGDTEGARALLATYAGWFPRFYVELQNHEIDHGDGWNDSKLADSLLSLATELGLPVIVTQDAHYCTRDERALHETLKRLVAFGPDEDDAVFPGDGFQLPTVDWFARHHPPHRLRAGAEGLGDLLRAHDLKIPELDSYSYNIPFTVADPAGELSRRTREELVRRGLDLPRYRERWQEEIDIVSATHMAGYLMLVAEVTDWCRDGSVFYRARGSAAGSLLCWLLGITPVDPLRWGLRVERFLSKDRTKPPDIDLDVEYDRRADLLEWLRTRFAVEQIGTWHRFSLGVEETDAEGEVNSKGSLRVAYFARARATGSPVTTWNEIPAEDKKALYDLDASTVLKSYGTHAAGLVVTTTEDDRARLIPSMWIASSHTMVTQYGMNDVEALGAVKLDVLGLKTLTVLHRCMDNLGRNVADGLEWIPLDDSRTFTAIGRGATDGVFQLEGGSARRGCRELRPTHIRDVIAAMALFRPAAMETGATSAYIERKAGRQAVPTRHEILAKVTAKTYGIMIYQEQVIAILRDLGMEPEALTAFLKAIKASQKADMVKAEKTMAAAAATVHDLATAAGMTEDDFHWLWEAVLGFSKYGFNQAHATVYGQLAYYCAYLSVHHPMEFFAALLSVAADSGGTKEDGYLSAARSAGIRIYRPHVNHSQVNYSVDRRRGGIRRGLVMKHIGERAAQELVQARPAGGYADLTELARLVYRKGGRVSGLKAYLESGDTTVGTLGRLAAAGALDDLT